MAQSASDLAHDILVIDRTVANLRAELRSLESERLALVTALAKTLGPSTPARISTALGAAKLEHKRRVTFPTQSSDEGSRDLLISALHRLNLWDHYSMLNYPALKSHWLANTIATAARCELAAFAHESTELVVSAEGTASRQTSITRGSLR